jgi:glycosyltransferase involved in cell wall biosynthesis
VSGVRIGVDGRSLRAPLAGIGRYTLGLVRALADEGVELRVYVPGPQWGAAAVARAAVDMGQARRRAGRLAWWAWELPRRAARDGVEVFWGPGHRLPPGLPAGMARVVTVHDLVWRHAPETMARVNRWLDRWGMPAAVRAADRVAVVSEHTARDVAAAFPEAAGKLRVVSPGVAPAPVRPLPAELAAQGLRPGGYVLFVGTLEPRKNLRRLLEAYARLPQALRAAFPLVIAGGAGWGGVAVQRWAEELGVAAAVRVLGYVTDETLEALQAQAAVLAMPSVYEGFGLPLLEAMRFGVPVLTANVASMPEVAGEAGVLVDPYEVDSIAAGLARLLGDAALRARLGAAGRGRAQAFTWARAARTMVVVFEEALAARRGMGR